ncbi:MAG TPA: hypothetical protein GYA07_11215 [Verrucomicrobia bacterium]|nr:hypothetical protein [Verrucomicrobiota bacterium]HOB32968.1 hypothetical protein [Verrucomicrobiota bacterium]HOP98526.1 hypothetical protein [Verrucomicrobiota bacterium]HPU56076.1 hypothetical protein [Verrucomicrobiota bacterium]
MSRRQKWIWIGLFVVILSAPLWLSFLGFFAWSPVNCWHYDVDIRSGRVRYTRYLLFAQVAQRVEETALSKALQPEDLAGVQPDWHRVAAFSPGVHHSPHYTFHSALGQMRELEMIWRTGGFTPAARRASARQVLRLWQRHGHDGSAQEYLRALSEIALRSDVASKGTDEEDLPAPEQP